MKKVLILVLTVIVVLTACGKPVHGEGDENERFKGTGGYEHSYNLIKDTETGCEYLLAKMGYGAGITPLYNSDGTIKCE